MKSPKSPESIMELLRSIQNVRLDKDGEVEIQFVEGTPSVFPDRWEPCAGYVHGTFTEQLFLLIQDALAGELEDGKPGLSAAFWAGEGLGNKG